MILSFCALAVHYYLAVDVGYGTEEDSESFRKELPHHKYSSRLSITHTYSYT
jgi:hypothetical protein